MKNLDLKVKNRRETEGIEDEIFIVEEDHKDEEDKEIFLWLLPEK